MCKFVFADHCRLAVMSVTNNDFIHIHIKDINKIANISSMRKCVSKYYNFLQGILLNSVFDGSQWM